MAGSERTTPDGVPNYAEYAALFARPALQAEIVVFKRAVELAPASDDAYGYFGSINSADGG
jgi:hypothetical protein